MTLITAHMCSQWITQLSPPDHDCALPYHTCQGVSEDHAASGMTQISAEQCLPRGICLSTGEGKARMQMSGSAFPAQPTPAQRAAAAAAGADVKASKGNPDKLPVSQLWGDATHSLQTCPRIPSDTAQPLLELQGSPQAFQ